LHEDVYKILPFLAKKITSILRDNVGEMQYYGGFQGNHLYWG
jgi:hypothetical protein